MSQDSKRGSKKELDGLFGELDRMVSQPGFHLDLDAVQGVIDRVHMAQEDEKEKLRKKDQALVNTIARLRQVVDQAGWMPQGTAFAFRGVIAALQQIEGILWELKGEKGPIPKPQPPPGGGSGGGGPRP